MYREAGAVSLDGREHKVTGTGRKEEVMRVRTSVKAGAMNINRCESLRVRTGMRAGRLTSNRCEVFLPSHMRAGRCA